MPDKNKYAISLGDLMRQIAEKAQPGSKLLDTAYSAKYIRAYRVAMFDEKDFNPGVKEHETYRGVDMGYNQQWSGWPHIDSLKRLLGIPRVGKNWRLSEVNSKTPHLWSKVDSLDSLLKRDPVVQQSVENLFKTKYWDGTHLDQIHDQQIVDNIFNGIINQYNAIRPIVQNAANEVVSGHPKLKLHLKQLKLGNCSRIVKHFTFYSLCESPAVMLNLFQHLTCIV